MAFRKGTFFRAGLGKRGLYGAVSGNGVYGIGIAVQRAAAGAADGRGVTRAGRNRERQGVSRVHRDLARWGDRPACACVDRDRLDDARERRHDGAVGGNRLGSVRGR